MAFHHQFSALEHLPTVQLSSPTEDNPTRDVVLYRGTLEGNNAQQSLATEPPPTNVGPSSDLRIITGHGNHVEHARAVVEGSPCPDKGKSKEKGEHVTQSIPKTVQEHEKLSGEVR